MLVCLFALRYVVPCCARTELAVKVQVSTRSRPKTNRRCLSLHAHPRQKHPPMVPRMVVVAVVLLLLLMLP